MNEAEEAKERSRGVSRDMSPQAIFRRFDILVELNRAARELQDAGMQPEQPPKKRKQQ